MNDSLCTERTTQCVPATIAWSATKIDVCSEPAFPDDAFFLQFVVLSGERHVYRLKREFLTQLFDRISNLLGKTGAAKKISAAAELVSSTTPKSCVSITHISAAVETSMSPVQGETTATSRSRYADSILSEAEPRHARATRVDHVAEPARPPLRGVWQVVVSWLRRRNDRTMLRSFSLRDIHDFCPRHTEAEAEMNKPFWRG